MVDGPGAAGTVKVPGVGATKKRTVYIFGVAAVVVAGVAYYRYTQNANSAPATGTDPTANEIDPATGYTYGSADDAAALQANEAYQYPATGSGAGGSGTVTSSTGTTLTTNVPQTNAEWSRACLNYLGKQVGDNAQNVQKALGDYLTGQDVVKGSDEESLILQAIAAYGYPPQPGPKNYPPGIKYAAAPGGTSNPPTPVTPRPPNPTKPPAKPPTHHPVKPKTRTIHYITKHGDNLLKVQDITGVNWKTIIKDNPGKLKGIHDYSTPVRVPMVLAIKVPA